jgi:DNA-binding NarL/FixJ family response regulator
VIFDYNIKSHFYRKLGEIMIRVVIFEDNKNFRESLSLYLASCKNIWLSGSYVDARDCLNIVKKVKPDVVLMDIEMPYMSGIEAMRLLKKQNPEVKILMQTIHDQDEKIFAAICAGANGYILRRSKPRGFASFTRDSKQGA